MKGRKRDKNGGKKKRLQKNWVYRYQKNLEERYNYDRRQCFIGYDLWYFYSSLHSLLVISSDTFFFLYIFQLVCSLCTNTNIELDDIEYDRHLISRHDYDYCKICYLMGPRSSVGFHIAKKHPDKVSRVILSYPNEQDCQVQKHGNN